MDWFKEKVGLQDPIYGPEGIQSVAAQADEVPFTELKKDDLKWFVMNSTCVETHTFYVTANTGHIAMVQIIYNSLGGIRTTIQFNSKVFYPDRRTPLWTSDPLANYGWDNEKYSFHADNCSVTLSEDGNSYTVKSSTSKQNIVDLKFTRAAPGFVVGKNGTTTYGTDPAKPWGSMHHAFWPRCKVTGSFLTQEGELPMEGLGLFIHGLQGMRPNLAAATWNFANFQSPTYSAVMMEFTTPPSYGKTCVNVGGIAIDDKIITAGARHTATHTEVKGDAEVDWPEPAAASYKWHGKDAAGAEVSGEISGPLETRMDRIDIMEQVPKFIKQIIAAAAGTKPYIYQYGPKMTLKIKHGEEEKTEEGTLFTEATFITSLDR